MIIPIFIWPSTQLINLQFLRTKAWGSLHVACNPYYCDFSEALGVVEADYDRFDIVCVIHGFKLVDCESYERRYWRCDNQPLAPGYYVVSWPDDCRVRRFTEQASYYGPFKQMEDARIVVEELRSLAAADPLIAVPARLSDVLFGTTVAERLGRHDMALGYTKLSFPPDQDSMPILANNPLVRKRNKSTTSKGCVVKIKLIALAGALVLSSALAFAESAHLTQAVEHTQAAIKQG